MDDAKNQAVFGAEGEHSAIMRPETLRNRVDAEFEEYVKTDMVVSRSQYESLIKIGMVRRDEAELKLQEKQEKNAKMDYDRRAREILNNFFFWWPGGYYRQVLQESKNRGDAESKSRVAFKEKLVRDMDEIVRDKGYDAIAEKVANRKGLAPEIARDAMLDVYFAMRDRGYDRSALRT